MICATALLGGCAVRKKPSIAWGTAVLVRPVAPPAPQQTVADPLEGAPDLRVVLTPPPNLTIPRILVPRPHVTTRSPATGENNIGDVPLLAPQLSTEETISAQRETNQSIAVAENNLASTRSRSLNAMQADLASKARGFVSDARDAARAGDWDRARSLAKKAQILSQELLDSL
jgi:hypothetical protein